MKIHYSFVSELPDPDAFRELMKEYYAVMLNKLHAAGGPCLSADVLAQDTMDHIVDLMPPEGRTLLATRDDGRLLGCGGIRKIRPDAAELKRMFVRPEAQGHGVGRKLFEMRMAEAREMGCRTLYADTVKGNRAMLSMYEAMGFGYVSRYAENANDISIAPYLVFLEYVFPEGCTDR